jgi:large subunit ribosomal protein L21
LTGHPSPATLSDLIARTLQKGFVMYAVFRTGGKQFRAEAGRRLLVPVLAADPGESVTFEEVLLAGDGEKVSVGAPLLGGASVTAEVLRHGRDRKVIVFKRKRRKGYRKKQGHRQGFTEIKVNEVVF